MSGDVFFVGGIQEVTTMISKSPKDRVVGPLPFMAVKNGL